MKSALIMLTAVALLGAGSTLAFMNDACKSGHHAWCAPSASMRVKIPVTMRAPQVTGSILGSR
jgi:hypothetical protein